jgi:D-3-phosphoglycerate dehydrogenase
VRHVRTVLVTDVAWPSTDVEAAILDRVGAALVCAKTGAEDELVRLAPDADGILTCWKRVGVRVIEAAPRLRVIGRYGVGLDNIDVAAATRRGIVVTNVPAFCTDEVAEHVLALVFEHVRRVARFDAEIRDGRWSPIVERPLSRLRGRTLGIVGFGAIGRALAERARGLGLNVVVTTRTRPIVPNVELVGLEELLTRADVVSLHVPLTGETRGLADRDFLQGMRRGAYLINTSRGAVVDSSALDEALRSGWIAGAGLDVTDPEPLPGDHPLRSAPNLILTPHVAFSSAESLQTLQVSAAESVAAVLEGRRPANVVNPEVLA